MHRKTSLMVLLIVLASMSMAIACFFLFVGNSNAQEDRVNMQPDLIFGLGDDAEEVARTAKVPISRSHISTALMFDASKIATGVEPIFEFRWPRGNILFPQATDVEFMADTEEKGGIRNIQIVFKMADDPTGVPDVAAWDAYDIAVYRYVMNVIARINAAGLKRYIGLSWPRVEGLRTYAFEPEEYAGPSYAAFPLGVYADQNYHLSLDEWRHLPRSSSIEWVWYSDGTFFELKYMKCDRSQNSSVAIGDQLFLTIKSESAWLDVYGPTYESARETYRQEIPKLLLRRAAEEARARALGAHIRTDWVDPIIAGVYPPKN